MFTPCLSHRLAPVLLLLAAPVLADDDVPPLSPTGSFTDFGHFVAQDGETLYRSVCQGCHMPDARGAQGAGAYPALASNPRLASATYTATTVTLGRANMPPFFIFMSDQQIAVVVNFVRTHFDNHYADAVTPDDVKAMRPAAPGDKP